ncbi:anti-sigma factor antagonist [Bacillus gobiensis]|uniref:anti-sigma factor antagonist n=1 Tax=Bacillus gobiensis TaxID=1441095 RepID=UPI003D1FA989
MNLLVEVTKSELNHKQIDVSGEIDVHTAPVLREKLMAHAAPESYLDINLENVSYMDSTGLGVFVGLYKALRAENGALKLYNLSDRLVRLFEITGLKDIIDISAKTEGGVQ